MRFKQQMIIGFEFQAVQCLPQLGWRQPIVRHDKQDAKTGTWHEPTMTDHAANARCYRTDTPSAGQVQGAATYTLNYQ